MKLLETRGQIRAQSLGLGPRLLEGEAQPLVLDPHLDEPDLVGRRMSGKPCDCVIIYWHGIPP